ncbi:hypothetical protein [Hahella sp. CCB-MM4]|uniref:hypothetical protein n=1 Tax=Hahella sp. (strain CCB-MM4) TaxID=1926491 RepID=UPI000B9AF605|nr:hypothetical protein [Hahella sp. CCB-MM4]
MKIQVLETNVLHASDVIYWLDGSTHTDTTQMHRVAHSLSIEFSTYPKDLKVIQSAGKTGLLRKPTQDIVDGRATEAQRTFVAGSPYALEGQVTDPKGFYNARTFSLTAGAADGHGIVLYPTPIGSRVNKTGALFASLRWSGDGSPVPWAIATLTITIPGVPQPQIYKGQADYRGELVIPWPKVPPLSAGQDHYDATLAVTALQSATEDTPIDPSTLIAAELESTTSENSFSDPIGLQVVPGEMLIVRSASKDHLTVQPS